MSQQTIKAPEGNQHRARGAIRRGLEIAPVFKRGFGISLLLALLATAGQIIVPMTVQHAIDDGINAPGGVNESVVEWTCGLAALGVLLASICSYLMNVRLFRASESGLAVLRVKAFAHVHELSTLTVNASRRGSMVSRVTSDVDQISNFVQRGGMTLLTSLAQVIVASALMLYYSVPLTLIVWVCFAPLFFLLRYFQRMVARAYGEVRERVGDMLAVISESISGMATVKAFGIERREQQRIDEVIEPWRRSAIRAQIRAVGAFVSGQAIAGLTLTIVLIAGGYFAAHGEMTLGAVTAFVFLANLFTQPVQTATEVLNDLQNALAGWGRIIELLDTPIDVAEPTAPVALTHDASLGLESLVFSYPGTSKKVIDALDAHVNAGTRVAVVGETGSGKSTLAKLLTRLVDPSSGRVTLGGVDLRDAASVELRQRIAYLPQEGFLFSGTIADNVRFARPELSDTEIEDAFAALGLRPWLEVRVDGIHTDVGSRGSNLSAGEKQMVALARTYVTSPDVLVLDEATSSLDPASDVMVTAALDELMRGRTSVIIAHRMATAERADEVWVMDGGFLAERGSHEELVNAGGIYARLHEGWVASHSTSNSLGEEGTA